MSKQRGGIAPNIAYSMALLGTKPRVMATVGEDFEEYRAWLESRGIDTAGAKVIPGEFTASFFVNTDRANAQIASFYPGAMAYAAQHSLHQLVNNPPDLVVISPNDPEAMNQYVVECQELGIPFIFDPSQQIVRLDGPSLEAGILGARALFVNDYEAGLIEKMTDLKLAELFSSARQDEDDFLVISVRSDPLDQFGIDSLDIGRRIRRVLQPRHFYNAVHRDAERPVAFLKQDDALALRLLFAGRGRESDRARPGYIQELRQMEHRVDGAPIFHDALDVGIRQRYRT